MRWLALLCGLAACSRNPRSGKAARPAAPVPVELAWGDGGVPAFAPGLGAVTAAAARPGHYAASIEDAESSFRTTEISESTHVRGAITLTLDPDGAAQACLGKLEAHHSSVGWLASHTGKTETTDSHSSATWGYGGRWALHGPWLDVVLADRDSVCPPRPQRDPSAGPRLHCLALAPAAGNSRLPMPVLACRLTDPPQDPRGWVVPLGAHDDPWVVLGAGNGVRVSWQHTAHSPPALVLTVPAQPIRDDAWKHAF